MKTYHRPLESNGCDSGFVKSALYVLEIDDKSSFSMSGHVPYSPTDTAVASVASVSRDLPRICFEQVSEYSACTVEGLDASTKILFLGFLQSLHFSPAIAEL